MTISEYKAEYKGLGFSDVKSLISSSMDFRQETEAIYRAAFNDTLNHNCPDCWFDAYLRIMNTDTARLNLLTTRLFVLKAGAILEDVAGRDPKLLVNRHTCTDEIAMYHLRTCPDYIRLFERYPEDWQAMALASDPEVIAAKQAAKQAAEEPKAAATAVKKKTTRKTARK